MPYLDTTGAACLDQVRGDLEREDIAMVLAAAKGPVRAMLDRAGQAGRITPPRMFPSVAAAVEELAKTGPFGLPFPAAK
jgi:MFS superfamily sulfate permease-like transporter